MPVSLILKKARPDLLDATGPKHRAPDPACYASAGLPLGWGVSGYPHKLAN